MNTQITQESKIFKGLLYSESLRLLKQYTNYLKMEIAPWEYSEKPHGLIDDLDSVEKLIAELESKYATK